MDLPEIHEISKLRLEPGDILMFMEILKTKLVGALSDNEPMPDAPSLDGA